MYIIDPCNTNRCTIIPEFVVKGDWKGLEKSSGFFSTRFEWKLSGSLHSYTPEIRWSKWQLFLRLRYCNAKLTENSFSIVRSMWIVSTQKKNIRSNSSLTRMSEWRLFWDGHVEDSREYDDVRSLENHSKVEIRNKKIKTDVMGKMTQRRRPYQSRTKWEQYNTKKCVWKYTHGIWHYTNVKRWR